MQTMWNSPRREKHVLVNKIFINGLEINFLMCLKKSMIWKYFYNLVKKSFRRHRSAKKIMKNLLVHERILHYWFPWKKKWNPKRCFLLPALLAKFALFIEWFSYLLNDFRIYVLIHSPARIKLSLFLIHLYRQYGNLIKQNMKLT